MPTPLSIQYCTEQDIQAYLSIAGEQAALDDDNTGGPPSGTYVAYLTTQGINYACERVNFHCQPRYHAGDLQKSWLVNEWATVIASHWLTSRRCNPVPESIKQSLYGDGSPLNRGVMGEMEDVRSGKMFLPNIGLRTSAWPAWSNVRVDPRYMLRQIRVERPISERTPTAYPQDIDYLAEYTPFPD